MCGVTLSRYRCGLLGRGTATPVERRTPLLCSCSLGAPEARTPGARRAPGGSPRAAPPPPRALPHRRRPTAYSLRAAPLARSWPNCFLYTLSAAIGTRAHLNTTSRRDAHAVPLVHETTLLSWSAVVTPAGLTTLSPRIVFDCFILTSLGLLFAAHKHTQGAVQSGRLHGEPYGPCTKPFPSKQGYTMTL